nr:MAG TPA: hypothetical protein [Bacteriophage sp.]
MVLIYSYVFIFIYLSQLNGFLLSKYSKLSSLLCASSSKEIS